jgi:hypothetical protein
MPHEDVLVLVNELLSRKVPTEEIKKKLLDKGYSIADINGAIARAQLTIVHPGVVSVSYAPAAKKGGPSGGLITTIGVIALCIIIFVGALGGPYWYASRSLSESTGLLSKIVSNASDTPALSPTDIALAPPTGKLPVYSPTHTSSYASTHTTSTGSASAPSALTSTQPVKTPAPSPSPTPAPSIIQQIVQDIIPSPAPTLTLTLAGNPIPYGGDASLTWTSTDTTSCTASQGWEGDEPTSGSETFSGLLSNVTYALSCTGPGGTVTQYAQVTVSVPDTGGGGGGGSPISVPTPDPTPDPVPDPTPSPSPNPTPGVPTIAAGCAVPSSSGGNSFYVDPVNGNDTLGDGSQGNPWKTLSTVLSTDVNTMQYTTPYYPIPSGGPTTIPMNASGPIHPGDTIFLMSGNYGAITVKGVNSDFIKLAAAPGQTPVFTSLTVQGSAKWIFQGLKIQNLRDSFSSLVSISTHASIGPVNNIIFDHNIVSSIDDSSSWTVSDWLADASYVGISLDEGADTRDSTCLTITNNQISNVKFGIGFGIDNSLLANNTVNDFAGDGVDYDASNILLSHNTIMNARDIDANHPDGFQGQIGRQNTSDPNAGYTNVTIDGNIVYRKTIPNLPFANALQGIDAFDENWTNLTVTNNVIVTDAYNGIYFSSIHTGLIANNTVIFDGCEGDGDGCSTTSWLGVGSTTHEGIPSTNVTVRNNISTQLNIDTPVVTLDHNITSGQISITTATTTNFYSKAGTYGNDNTLSPNLNAGFVQFDTTNLLYNLHLLSSSPANGFGSTDQAPSVDIEGNPRVAPIAAGAYTSSYPAVAYEGSRSSLLASVYEALGNFWSSLWFLFAAL